MQARISFFIARKIRAINYINSSFFTRQKKNGNGIVFIFLVDLHSLFPDCFFNPLRFYPIKISTDRCSQIISLNILIFMNHSKKNTRDANRWVFYWNACKLEFFYDLGQNRTGRDCEMKKRTNKKYENFLWMTIEFAYQCVFSSNVFEI